MTEDFRLGEIFDSIGKYTGGDDSLFDQFKNQEFFRYGPDYRIAVLSGWDRIMQQETRPNRETAMWIARKRELDDLHQLLSRAGR
jgi:hypothetical protein